MRVVLVVHGSVALSCLKWMDRRTGRFLISKDERRERGGAGGHTCCSVFFSFARTCCRTIESPPDSGASFGGG